MKKMDREEYLEKARIRKRNYYQRNKEEEKRKSRIYRAKHGAKLYLKEKVKKIFYPEKIEAKYAVRNALRNNKISKPDKCSLCYLKCKPEAHHTDYSKKLEVVWLCRACHQKTHYKEIAV